LFEIEWSMLVEVLEEGFKNLRSLPPRPLSNVQYPLFLLPSFDNLWFTKLRTVLLFVCNLIPKLSFYFHFAFSINKTQLPFCWKIKLCLGRLISSSDKDNYSSSPLHGSKWGKNTTGSRSKLSGALTNKKCTRKIASSLIYNISKFWFWSYMSWCYTTLAPFIKFKLNTIKTKSGVKFVMSPKWKFSIHMGVKS
jgi:hypothetical protein